jgi:predicted MFS family arabinose efflux permease
VLFTLASLLCGLAPGAEAMVAARAFQGFAGAVMVPQVLSIAQTIFPPQERGQAFALFGLTAGLAAVSGPVIGGLLIEADIFGLGWRPIFLINLLPGTAALILGRGLIPAIPGNPALRLDLAGVALASAGLFCLIFPLVEGRNFGWAPWCFAMIAAAVLLFWGFVAWEARQARTGQPALLPHGLMVNWNFAFGSLLSLLYFSALPAFFFIFALFLQAGFGFRPIESGLTTVPFPAGILLASIVNGRIGFRWQRERMLAGLVLLFAGMALVRHQVGQTGDMVDHRDFLLPLLMAGIGLGTSISPLFQTILAGVPVKDAGAGSGALQAVQQAGGAFGVAVVSEFFFRSLNAAFAGGAGPHAAFAGAVEAAMLWNLGIYAVVALGALALRRPVLAGGPERGPAVAE